jgi:hypothetical protein
MLMASLLIIGIMNAFRELLDPFAICCFVEMIGPTFLIYLLEQGQLSWKLCLTSLLYRRQKGFRVSHGQY